MEARHVAFDWGNCLIPDPRYVVIPQIAGLVSETIKGSTGRYVEPASVVSVFYDVDGLKRNTWVGVTHFGQEDPIFGDLLMQLNVSPGDAALLAPNILSAYRAKWMEFVKGSKDWNNERVETLKALKEGGAALSILSNDRMHTCRAALEWAGMLDFFGYIATAHEYGLEKHPNVPESRDRFLRETGFRPQETVYVGDDSVRDIKWAKGGGMNAVLYVPPPEFRKGGAAVWRAESGDTEPDLVINNFSELKNSIRTVA